MFWCSKTGASSSASSCPSWKAISAPTLPMIAARTEGRICAKNWPLMTNPTWYFRSSDRISAKLSVVKFLNSSR